MNIFCKWQINSNRKYVSYLLYKCADCLTNQSPGNSGNSAEREQNFITSGTRHSKYTNINFLVASLSYMSVNARKPPNNYGTKDERKYRERTERHYQILYSLSVPFYKGQVITRLTLHWLLTTGGMPWSPTPSVYKHDTSLILNWCGAANKTWTNYI